MKIQRLEETFKKGNCMFTQEEAKELFNLASIFVSAVKHRIIRNISDAKKFFQEEYTERFLSNLPFAEAVVID